MGEAEDVLGRDLSGRVAGGVCVETVKRERGGPMSMSCEGGIVTDVRTRACVM